MEETEQKGFWFEVRGKLYAKDGEEATSNIWDLLDGKVERFEITELDEEED